MPCGPTIIFPHRHKIRKVDRLFFETTIHWWPRTLFTECFQSFHFRLSIYFKLNCNTWLDCDWCCCLRFPVPGVKEEFISENLVSRVNPSVKACLLPLSTMRTLVSLGGGGGVLCKSLSRGVLLGHWTYHILDDDQVDFRPYSRLDIKTPNLSQASIFHAETLSLS